MKHNSLSLLAATMLSGFATLAQAQTVSVPVYLNYDPTATVNLTQTGSAGISPYQSSTGNTIYTWLYGTAPAGKTTSGNSYTVTQVGSGNISYVGHSPAGAGITLGLTGTSGPVFTQGTPPSTNSSMQQNITGDNN